MPRRSEDARSVGEKEADQTEREKKNLLGGRLLLKDSLEPRQTLASSHFATDSWSRGYLVPHPLSRSGFQNVFGVHGPQREEQLLP